MGDVAAILGLNEKPTTSADIAAKFFAEKPKAVGKGKKPKGMSREVFDLIGRNGDALVPSMQSNATLTTGAFKSKRASALKSKWVWAPFVNSARPKEGGNSAFFHWVKADVQYTDYPYAKFNIKLDPIIFSDDEYEHLLRSDKWSRAETDHLMYVCYKYDLRWPVIADRYMLMPSRKTEDIQERYYSIVTKIRSHRMGKVEGSIKHEPLTVFDLEAERNRRNQQECQFRKTKSDEAEETKLREELKMIDAVLKTKKEKVSKAAGADSRNAMRLAASESRQSAAAASLHSANFAASFALPVSSDNGPSAGKPGLQSTRLTSSDQSSGLSRVLLKKMNSILRELGAPEAPLPTRAVCDAYDGVKRDTVALLSLHNAIQKKEKEIATLRGLNCADVVHNEILLPHGSTLFSKMGPMDPQRPFPPPPPVQAPPFPTPGIVVPSTSSSYSSFAPQTQQSQGQPNKMTMGGQVFPGTSPFGAGPVAMAGAPPPYVPPSSVSSTGAPQHLSAGQVQGPGLGQGPRPGPPSSSSYNPPPAALPHASSSTAHHMGNIPGDPAAGGGGTRAGIETGLGPGVLPPSAAPAPPKKLSSYKRKMAAIAAEKAAAALLGGEGFPGGQPAGPSAVDSVKEKKPKKDK